MAKANFKTNALRILETNKIEYKMHTYECKEFKDGVEIAQIVGKPQEIVFKTIVCVGASKEHYVFVVPVAKELDLKACARAVSEKSVELIKLTDITKVTGYIRGGCSPIGMKKKFPTYFEETALLFDEITVSAGVRGCQLLVKSEEIIAATDADCTDLI